MKDPSAEQIRLAQSRDETARRAVFLWAYNNSLHYIRWERKMSPALHWARVEGMALDLALDFIDNLPRLNPETAANWFSKTLKWTTVRRAKQEKWKKNNIVARTMTEKLVAIMNATGELDIRNVSTTPHHKGLEDDDLLRLRAIDRAYQRATPSIKIAFDYINADPRPPHEDIQAILGISVYNLSGRITAFKKIAEEEYIKLRKAS